MSAFRKVLLPGIILQSVLIGGGFATGREIVEYGARYGNVGWICGVSIFLGFSLLAFLTFEACRQWNVYDYKSLLKRMLGPFWIGYEISYLLLAVLIIAVMASAAGAILNDTFGLNTWIGVVLIVIAVGALNYFGENVIASMKTIGTIALFGAYILFAIVVFKNKGHQIIDTMTMEQSQESVGWLALIWTGMLYVGYNLAVYPATFFTIKQLSTKRDSFLASIMAGLLMTVPWFLTYFALMAFYPSAEVIQAPVPWLKMLEGMGPYLVVVFGLVVGWTLIETATGIIHAFVNRVEVEYKSKTQKDLSGKMKAFISLLALILAMILSRVGIIDLIAKGYAFMAYAMILFYAIPLLVYAPGFIKRKGSIKDPLQG